MKPLSQSSPLNIRYSFSGSGIASPPTGFSFDMHPEGYLDVNERGYLDMNVNGDAN